MGGVPNTGFGRSGAVLRILKDILMDNSFKI
jgi:hypothetical protein